MLTKESRECFLHPRVMFSRVPSAELITVAQLIALILPTAPTEGN